MTPSQMASMDMAVSTGYDLRLVALSVIIAIVASYTALDLAGRVTVARGRMRALWLWGGAVAMGVGIWSMHFIGMLAFHASMPTTYHVPTVLFSLLPAVLVSGLALFTVSHDVMTLKAWAGGGIFMGLGIGAMHYSGMAAMRVGTVITYDPLLFATSIGIAIAASLVALWLAFHLRGESRYRRRWTMASAVLMGFAIAGMHYTGMAAATFKPMSMGQSMSAVHGGTGTSSLAIGIGIGAFVILSFTLLSSLVDKRLTAHTAEARALRESEERLRGMSEQLNRQLQYTRAITDSLGEGVCVLDAGGAVTSTNPAAEHLFGRREADLVGRNLHALLHPHHHDGTATPPDHCPLGGLAEAPGAIHVNDDTFVRQDGTVLVIAYSLSPVLVDGEAVGSVVAFHDITERKVLEIQLRHQALHDALTDLPNRTLLRDRLQSEILSADHHGSSFALLFMDLDRFKDVNDTLGHHAGDQLLKEVALRLSRTLWESDLIARLGGDEFAVVLPAIDLNGARHVTEKIQQALKAPLVLDNDRMDLSASIGIALYPMNGDDVSALMRHADVAMYAAKRSGRSSVAISRREGWPA